MSSGGNNPTPGPKDPGMSHLDYRGIFWLTVGSLVIPIYLVACILSIIKAHNDRKLIKARILARQLKQPPPPVPESPLDIIAREVRENKWHKRKSSMTLVKIQSLLRANASANSNAHQASQDSEVSVAGSLGEFEISDKRSAVASARDGSSREGPTTDSTSSGVDFSETDEYGSRETGSTVDSGSQQ
ncbi:hypothetical protein RRG08_009342 [Elysia crispata]|uniref:Uncharacterized protein n=1 Tax=Elysia crispata TaxID=231223 RepID=A0AAE1CSL0_9GAST|nr:hypothetical protein RRG08_009342 [Elysia crispata]